MHGRLPKGRKTMIVQGYAVQWFTTISGHTKVIIYTKMPPHIYTHMTDFVLDYIADEFSVEEAAKIKIKEVESYD